MLIGGVQFIVRQTCSEVCDERCQDVAEPAGQGQDAEYVAPDAGWKQLQGLAQDPSAKHPDKHAQDVENDVSP